MTLYAVGYYSASGWSLGGPFIALSDAQNAYNWYITLSGITYVVMLSWQTTTVQSWGTAPI